MRISTKSIMESQNYVEQSVDGMEQIDGKSNGKERQKIRMKIEMEKWLETRDGNENEYDKKEEEEELSALT